MPEDRIVLDRHDDPYRWVRNQADRLAGRSGLAADPIALSEFLDDVAEEMVADVRGLLIQLLIHLLKLSVFDEPDSRRHWIAECAAFQAQILDRYRPSMRQRIDVDTLWRRATKAVIAQAEDRTLTLPRLPHQSPLTLDDLVDEDALIADLVGRLSAAITADTP